MAIRRIKYVSRFSRPLEASDIELIGEVSRVNNAERGITGLLMTSGGLFLQILEGPPQAVETLWKTITVDERHKDVLMLSDETVDRRLFPDWAMKTISLGSSTAGRLAPVHTMVEAISAQREVIDRLLGSIERAVWEEYVHGGQRTETVDE